MIEEEYIKIGKLNTKLFKKMGQHLITDEVIFTYERMNHVAGKRVQLFDEVKDILPEVLYNPDYVYKDWNNRENTLVLIKSIDAKQNLNVVLKIAIKLYKFSLFCDKISLENRYWDGFLSLGFADI